MTGAVVVNLRGESKVADVRKISGWWVAFDGNVARFHSRTKAECVAKLQAAVSEADSK